MKAEFKENEQKPVSHVGLYRGKNSDFIAFFPNENNPKQGVIVLKGQNYWDLGECYSDFIACTDTDNWEKLNANEIKFTW